MQRSYINPLSAVKQKLLSTASSAGYTKAIWRRLGIMYAVFLLLREAEEGGVSSMGFPIYKHIVVKNVFKIGAFLRLARNHVTSSQFMTFAVYLITFRAVFNWVSKVIRQLRLVLVLVLLQFQVS